MKLSPTLAQMQPPAADEFKNAYSLEFLGLSDGHSEADLHHALLRNLGRFITEHLRDHAHRVHEVAFRTKARSWPSGESRPEFYDSVSLASHDDLARGLASCVRVSAEESLDALLVGKPCAPAP